MGSQTLLTPEGQEVNPEGSLCMLSVLHCGSFCCDPTCALCLPSTNGIMVSVASGVHIRHGCSISCRPCHQGARETAKKMRGYVRFAWTVLWKLKSQAAITRYFCLAVVLWRVDTLKAGAMWSAIVHNTKA